MIPLPPQPEGVPWPTEAWPEAEPAAEVDRDALSKTFDEAFAAPELEATGETLALLVVHRGQVVAERYADGKDASDTFISWSMAKSITHALVGVLVGEGQLDVDAPAPVPTWQGDGDARARIRLEDLLRMVDGLDFFEDYEDGKVSDVIEMLFGSGKADVASYAEARPAIHAPGEVWSYSSGTSNIVAAILRRCIGGEQVMRKFMSERLFEPLGMKTATPRFDDAGTFIGSSYVFATARDFARFGTLYLRDGVWHGTRLLPEGWVDHARRLTPASNGEYGAHWWLAMDGSGIFHCSGFRGQYIAVDPSRDLILVRLGVSTPRQRGNVLRGLRRIVHAFPLLEGRR